MTETIRTGGGGVERSRGGSYAEIVQRNIAREHAGTCGSRFLDRIVCPHCGAKVRYAEGPSYLNPDQWDSIKAGDWYCDNAECTGSRHLNGNVYLRDREMEHQPCDCPLRDAAALTVLAGLIEGATQEDADLIDRRIGLMKADMEARKGRLDVVQISNALAWERVQTRVSALVRSLAAGYHAAPSAEDE